METFKDVISSDQLVLVDFFATWCQPCKMMHPILEQVKEVLGDRIRIIKVDVDKYGVTASQYGIQSVPTLMLFRRGEVLWRTSGVMQKSELLATIEPKTRFSVCRKALSDFKKLKPSEDSVAELMVFYMENACQFTYDYGDMWEQFYDSVESNFDKTLRHIVLYDLWDKYDSRIKQCLRWASPCGWGFPDALNDMYEEMKAQNEELRKKYRNFKMPINADY